MLGGMFFNCFYVACKTIATATLVYQAPIQLKAKPEAEAEVQVPKLKDLVEELGASPKKKSAKPKAKAKAKADTGGKVEEPKKETKGKDTGKKVEKPKKEIKGMGTDIEKGKPDKKGKGKGTLDDESKFGKEKRVDRMIGSFAGGLREGDDDGEEKEDEWEGEEEEEEEDPEMDSGDEVTADRSKSNRFNNDYRQNLLPAWAKAYYETHITSLSCTSFCCVMFALSM